ncbi:MAG: YqgE/AlgH family protein [Sandaracinaceae bacterium]|nr:YqgE/AlgH family protein [Sandaracinaceae bacterium]
MADTLAPGFLVAAPSLRDPSFVRSVVMLVEHGKDGSLGFVINRVAAISFAQVAELLSLEGEGAIQTPVYSGGPVAPQSGWILFDPEGVSEAVREDAVVVSEHLCVSASRKLLSAIARGEGPKRSLLALGYAGWGAGQLDAEMKLGIWIPVDLDDEIVFDTPADERWTAALTGAGIDPARMSGGGGFSA